MEDYIYMAFNKKTWKDRKSQYPDRRKFVNVDTGAVFTCDVTREEGQVTQEGTQLDAENFNDLETRIDDAISDASNSITTVSDNVDGLSTVVHNKQDTLTAGTGISIVNNVISVSLTDADTQEY